MRGGVAAAPTAGGTRYCVRAQVRSMCTLVDHAGGGLHADFETQFLHALAGEERDEAVRAGLDGHLGGDVSGSQTCPRPPRAARCRG